MRPLLVSLVAPRVRLRLFSRKLMRNWTAGSEAL